MWLIIVVLVVVGGALTLLDVVPAAYVFGPLVGLAILRVGWATFGSLRQGAAHVPDGPPEPVDLDVERISYTCEGCGAVLLLLVRGTTVAPRHCGERMHERGEIARDARP